MEANKLFSVQSNGYSVSEVDDYVSFIQTELTKNMKINRDIQNRNESLTDSITQLKSDNNTLNEKNMKLYKDCVAFAKRLKALEIYDNSIDISKKNDNENALSELKNAYDILYKENQELKAKLYNANNNNIDTNDTYVLNDDNLQHSHEDVISNDKIETQEFVQEPTSTNVNIPKLEEKSEPIPVSEEIHSSKLKPMSVQDYNDSLTVDENDDEKINKEKIQNIKSEKGKATFYKVLKVVINIIFTLAVILAVISGITYAFIKHPAATIGGYRTYSVWQDDKDKNLSQNDIVIVKKVSPAEVKKNNKVLIKSENTRNIINVSSVKNNKENLVIYSVVNKNEEKEVSIKNVIGKVSNVMPNIGVISNYAFTNTYDYIAIISCTLLICLFIKILLSLKKAKNKKVNFGDYNMSDFSLDI